MNDAFQNSPCWTAACIAAVVIPLLPLFQLSASYAADWPCQLWLISYFASYFAAHHAFPLVLNTVQIVGMPYPLFYGYLFFPLAGAIASLVEPGMTMRLIVGLLTACQFVAIYKLAARSSSKLMAFALSASTVWAIYPLTNLYHRGAIPEFVATALLQCALCTWLICLRATTKLRVAGFCSLTVLLLTLCAGTHPITAVYGLVFFAFFGSATLCLIPSKQAKTVILLSIVPILMGALCLAPWVMTTAKWSKRIALAGSFQKVAYYPTTIDAPLTRLSLLPRHDPLYASQLAAITPVKYLDTQISWPLIALFALLWFGALKQGKTTRKLTITVCLMSAALVGVTVLSVVPGWLDHFGVTFRSIQFAYRLVTYINMTALAVCLIVLEFQNQNESILVIAPTQKKDPVALTDGCNQPCDHPEHVQEQGSSAHIHGHDDSPISLSKLVELVEPVPINQDNPGFKLKPLSILTVMIILLAAAAMASKLRSAQAVAVFENTSVARGDKSLLRMGPYFYGYEAYGIPLLYDLMDSDETAQSKQVYFSVLDGSHFGDVETRVITSKPGQWVLTNVQEFPWNKLCYRVSGAVIDPPSLKGNGKFLAMRLPADQGNFDYKCEPDPTWSFLHSLSIPGLLLWLIATAALLAKTDLMFRAGQQASNSKGIAQLISQR